MYDGIKQIAEYFDDLPLTASSWIADDFATEIEADARLFSKLGLPTRGRAIDLGCGTGHQAIALARSGLSVTAVDVSENELRDLAGARDDLPVLIKRSELVEALRDERAQSLAVVTCLGDTLPHLPDRETVRALFAEAARALKTDGCLLLSWRESARPLAGLERFAPRRTDEDHLIGCFLDTRDPEHIDITGIFRVRTVDGWRTLRSTYRKLSLNLDRVRTALENVGFASEVVRSGGLTTVLARKVRS